MNYVRCTLELRPPQPATEIFIAALADLGFESFEETSTGLKAYIQESQWDEAAFLELPYLASDLWSVNHHWEVVAPENWNAVWERDYTPIALGERCLVRASFHPKPTKSVEFDIVITPKMSFGTGHHQTTRLMMEYILDLQIADTTVLDVGTGTGVLAILCGMRGAKAITAIDIDPWSFENAVENAERNRQKQIEVLHGSMECVKGRKFQVVLANINRNALETLMPEIADSIQSGGSLLISGFYKDDLEHLRAVAKGKDLTFCSFKESDSWTAAHFEKG